MTAIDQKTTGSRPPSAAATRWAVRGAYAAQGAAYAAVVTALPSLQQRYELDDDALPIIMIGVVLLLVCGNALADLIAVRRSSRAAAVLGLALLAVSLGLLAAPIPLAGFFGALVIFGIGLGVMDGAENMQGILVQRSEDRPLMGGFFASHTLASMLAAVIMSLALASVFGASLTLAVAAGVAIVAAVFGYSRFDRRRAVRSARAEPVGPGGTDGDSLESPPTAPARRRATRLPVAGIWLFGFVVLAAFTTDSAVATWSTVLLADSGPLSPLGYAAYLAVMLATRLATDPLARRFGAPALVTVGTVSGVVGLAAVALAPVVGLAIAGFALTGVAVGILVPLAFSGAGRLAPEYSDEVIARVNNFNYAGALIGAVVVGVIEIALSAAGIVNALAVAFALPAVILAGVLLVARRFTAVVPGRAATSRPAQPGTIEG